MTRCPLLPCAAASHYNEKAAHIFLHHFNKKEEIQTLYQFFEELVQKENSAAVERINHVVSAFFRACEPLFFPAGKNAVLSSNALFKAFSETLKKFFCRNTFFHTKSSHQKFEFKRLAIEIFRFSDFLKRI